MMAAPPQNYVDYVSGSTRVYGIVGDPIEQVKSPQMFTTEFRARGLDAVLVPLHFKPQDFDAGVAGAMRLANLGGLVFTIPYKARACAFAEALGPQAQRVGAINALGRGPDGRWLGEIFDGLGCVEAFRRRGLSFAGKRVMLIGAGGAGGAIGNAIAGERPRSVRLHDLDRARVEALAEKISSVDSRIEVAVASATIEDVDILMNASPVGMLADARLPIDVRSLPRDLIVFDAVVVPERTPLMTLAEASGCTTVYGREMMHGQRDRMIDFFLSGRW
jgi:shikimate dehydrogenase